MRAAVAFLHHAGVYVLFRISCRSDFVTVCCGGPVCG